MNCRCVEIMALYCLLLLAFATQAMLASRSEWTERGADCDGLRDRFVLSLALVDARWMEIEINEIL